MIDGWLIKFDSEYNLEWDQLYGSSGHDIFYSVIENADGTYTAAGSSDAIHSVEVTDDNNGGVSDGIVVKFDNEGNHIWDQQVGGGDTDALNYIVATEDGGYVAVGKSKASGHELTDQNNGSQDGMIFKLK